MNRSPILLISLTILVLSCVVHPQGPNCSVPARVTAQNRVQLLVTSSCALPLDRAGDR